MTHLSITEEGNQQGLCVSESPAVQLWKNLIWKKKTHWANHHFLPKSLFLGDAHCRCHIQTRWLTSLNTNMCDLAPLGKREAVNRERLPWLVAIPCLVEATGSCPQWTLHSSQATASLTSIKKNWLTNVVPVESHESFKVLLKSVHLASYFLIEFSFLSCQGCVRIIN